MIRAEIVNCVADGTLGQKMLGGGGFVVVRCSRQFRLVFVE